MTSTVRTDSPAKSNSISSIAIGIRTLNAHHPTANPSDVELFVVPDAASSVTTASIKTSASITNSEWSLTSPTNSINGNDPNKFRRWQVLMLVCIMQFGTEYCYDLPGSLGAGEGQTIQTFFTSTNTSSSSLPPFLPSFLSENNFPVESYNQKMNQALYSVYSYPNLFMTVVGGLLIDKYLGLRKTSILMSTIATVSCYAFCVALYYKSYWLMTISRITFGIGGESLNVAQSAYMARWFAGTSFQALAFGFAISFARLGGGMSYIISPIIGEYGGVMVSTLAGCVLITVSLLGTFTVASIDSRSESAGRIATSDAKLYRESKRKPSGSTDNSLENGQTDFETPTKSNVAFQLSFIPSIPVTLWLVAMCALLCYSATFPFISIAKNYFERVYAYDSTNASFSAGLFHILGAFLCPAMGAIVDRFGRGPMWLCISNVGTTIVLSSLVIFPNGFATPKFVIFMLSSFYSIFVASTWPFAAHCVPASARGFAFGVISAAVNVGLATIPLLTGSILDEYTFNVLGDEDHRILPSAEGFRYAIGLLLCVVLAALGNAVALWIADGKNKGILMSAPSERDALKKERDDALVSEWSNML